MCKEAVLTLLAIPFLPVTILAAGAPEVVQTISSFHRPESVAFSLDGRTLFVSNCGSDVFGPEKKFAGFVAGRGAISKLAVGEDGDVTVVDLKFIDDLDGPVGVAVLPKATARYPEGTLLVNQGIALLTDERGAPVTDAGKLGTGILLFDPDSGAPLGKISLGSGSTCASLIGHRALLPNSLAFDGGGNLYVTDTAKGGDRLDPPDPGNPGLIRIEHGAIDAVSDGAADGELPRSAVTFTSIPGLPNGVGFWKEERALCVVTMGGTPPEGTAVYVIPEDSFPSDTVPRPFRGDVGTADGITFTPAGTIITSRFSGDLLAIPRAGDPFPLAIEKLTAPADHRLRVLGDGSSILAVPEQDRNDPNPWSQSVRIIRLPAGF